LSEMESVGFVEADNEMFVSCEGFEGSSRGGFILSMNYNYNGEQSMEECIQNLREKFGLDQEGGEEM